MKLKSIIKSLNNNERIIKIAIFQILTLSQTIVLNKLFTNFWNKDEAGIYFLILSISVIISSLSFNPLNQWLSRSVSQSNEFEKKTGDNIYILLSFLLVVTCCFFYYIEEFSYFTVCVFSLSEVVKLYLNTLYNAKSKLMNLINFTLLNGVIKITVIIMVVFIYPGISIESTILVMSICSVVIGLLYGRLHLPSYTRNKSNLEFNALFLFVVPLSLSSGLSIFREQYPRIMFSRLQDISSISDFSMMIFIATLVPISIQLLITTSFTPVYYKEFIINAKVANNKLKRVGLYAMICSLMYAVLFIFFGKTLIVLFSNESFLSLSNMIIVLVISYAIFVRSNIRTLYLFACSSTGMLLVINLIVSITSLIIYESMYKYYGFSGVALSLASMNLLFSIACELIIKIKGFK
ncbi:MULTISPECIES: hypothetical protein [unclassified Vibrio]|uniref:lipopolysaccharide biosynthesis protein n=1 Tax=unclassified Vibrio TaxID=2614977 RepID=UPI00296518BE|nr:MULTISPECIES: hypothetical protein [unclassified Vibrio]MDW1605358.1 hypothetical protein [Vibrio sp. Vb2977]MDW1668332.1 hypothetical protein [Vibrio sp. Vb2978]MDW1682515.1 hypothetical protein [Vibrio sp. Vb2942]